MRSLNLSRSENIVLGFILAFLAFFASLFGLFGRVYRDSDWAASQLKGQDLVTILVAFVLVVLLFFDAAKTELILAGLFGYLAYTYVTYVFGPELNPMFLIYIALMSLSVFALVLVFRQIGRLEVSPVSGRIFVVSSIYLIVVAVMLSILWLADIMGNLKGKPFLPNPTGEPLVTVYALDLGFVIPAMLYGAINVLRKKFWGYIVAGVMLVKSTTLGFALMAMAVTLSIRGHGLDLFLAVFWSVLGLVGLVLSLFFLRALPIRS
ncbi:MAG: hypothetical protein JXB23_11775 [Candidatus Aminicenantes bacterium]|nr:hypothetical protein [Candidatus Aminicenantes bacterium]